MLFRFSQDNLRIASSEFFYCRDYNKVNQLLSSTNPNLGFTYDASGNMTKAYTPEGYEFQAAYNAENRLKSIQYTDGASVVHKTEYIHDANGFVGIIKQYENSALIKETRMVRDGFLEIQERDQNNAITREYTWGLNLGGGIGGLLALKQNGQNYHYLYDGKGNVNAVLDAAQQIVASYRYDTFGRLMVKSGTLDQPFQFSTKRYDANTGLNYYGYRFYSGALGRWINRDPLGEAGGVNLYGFVENDPINKIDPLGEAPIDPINGVDADIAPIMGDIYYGIVEGAKRGWSSGYYQCFAKCMVWGGGASAPIITKGAEKAAEPLLEKGGSYMGRRYYTWKYPKRFSAGGKYSKVLAPRFGMTFAKAISVVGWGYFIYEEYECIKKCMKCLNM